MNCMSRTVWGTCSASTAAGVVVCMGDTHLMLRLWPARLLYDNQLLLAVTDTWCVIIGAAAYAACTELMLVLSAAAFAAAVPTCAHQMDRQAMVGVMSMKDVVRTLFEDQKHEIDSLKDYIHGGW